MVAIAVVHCDNRAAGAIAIAIFATGAAVSVLLIASHDRPFSGEISVKPMCFCKSGPSDTTLGGG